MDAFIISCLSGIRSIFAPGMFRVFVLSVALTIGSLIGFIALSSFFFSWLSGHLPGHFLLAHLLPWIGSLGSGVIAWFLFPGIMPVIINFFDNHIARLIEDQDYPATMPVHIPQFWPEFWHDVRFSLLTVTINILVLPLYLLPGLNLILFYLLNGYLLGREFFVMVARRHIPAHEAEGMRYRYGRSVMAAGIVLAFMATIPVVNLLAPFWGVAVMVHLYHRLAARQTAPLPLQQET